MKEERQDILNMLAAGKITVDEAQTLLEALESNSVDAIAQLAGLDPFDPQVTKHLAKQSSSKAAGKHDNSASDVIDQVLSLRIHGVNAQYVKEMRELGLGPLDTKQLMQMAVHDVTPEYVQKIRLAGYPEVNVKQVVNMRIHDVTPEFVEEIEAAGLGYISIDQLVALRIHNVNADLFKEMADLGLIDFEEVSLSKAPR